jgi:hypothetical protein
MTGFVKCLHRANLYSRITVCRPCRILSVRGEKKPVPKICDHEITRLSVSQWLYSPLLGLGHFFSSLIQYTIGNSSDEGSACRKHRLNAHRHPCLEWDWNPPHQCSNGRRLFREICNEVNQLSRICQHTSKNSVKRFWRWDCVSDTTSFRPQVKQRRGGTSWYGSVMKWVSYICICTQGQVFCIAVSGFGLMNLFLHFRLWNLRVYFYIFFVVNFINIFHWQHLAHSALTYI